MENKKLAAVCAFVFGITFAMQVYAVCNGSKAAMCNSAYNACVNSTGGDPDGTCELAYYKCLRAAGCPIP